MPAWWPKRLHSLFSRPFRPPAANCRRPRFRPEVETLDRRIVLAANTYTVNTTTDLGVGVGLMGDLRYCITQADANAGSTIKFNIGVLGGEQTITLQKDLPPLSAAVTIDGTSQFGYVNTPLIGINGNGKAAEGLNFAAANITVKALAIWNCTDNGIMLATGAGNDLVQISYIGTDQTGALKGAGNQSNGIYISSSGNTIGGAGSGNVISGNTKNGIQIEGNVNNTANTNQISQNLIGTTSAGNAPLPNGQNGILIDGGANNNTIGGLPPSPPGPLANQGTDINVISGNTGDGIRITDQGSANNVILANLIGTTSTGQAALGNGGNGIAIVSGASNNMVGFVVQNGTIVVAGSHICANGQAGILLSGTSTLKNQVMGNIIGLALNGSATLGNTGNGIVIDNSPSNGVGGAVAGEGNIISGNTGAGVKIQSAGATKNSLVGNYIGTDTSGTNARGNGEGVLIIAGASGNSIGAAGAVQVISGNTNYGIEIDGSANNLVLGNFIGTDVTGTTFTGTDNTYLGNGKAGVVLDDRATGNTIGAAGGIGAQNLISGNGRNGGTGSYGHGITILNAGTSNNLIEGNFIGTNKAGTAALQNSQDGVYLQFGADNNTIGGTAQAAGNVISGNLGNGVEIDCHGTLVAGNFIGTDWQGKNAVANGNDGVFIGTSAGSNTIGGTVAAAQNVISGNGNPKNNTGWGIEVAAVQGNTNAPDVGYDLIGYKVDAMTLLPNAAGGISGSYNDKGNNKIQP